MTSHLKQLPGWRSPSPSGDEDALVVIKQFTDGDEQNSLEVMDAIKQFADEDDFQDDLQDSSSSPGSETNYSIAQEWGMCPRIGEYRSFVPNEFYRPAHVPVSPPPLERQVSTTLSQECSASESHSPPPPPPYYQHYSLAYPSSPLPPSPDDNSAASQSSPCSVSPGPHTPLNASSFDSSYPSHPTEYTSGMVLMGSYQVCMNYLPPYGGEWSPLSHAPSKTFPAFSSDQAGSPSPNINDSAHDCTNVGIFTQSNGLQFYSEALDVVQPFLTRQRSDSSPEAKTKKSAKPKPRKVKPQVDVDIAGIKDIATSSQLWEFTLKILERPSYSYMVSWENKKEGVFRFHNAQAFATLWGRHRNRPNMTYDKVARALRYYYKRDILNQVGGRLTYKFSKRLQKMFSED